MNKSNTLTLISVKGDVSGTSNVGGILGYSEYSSCTGFIYEGNIVGIDNVGGICGYNYAANANTRCSYTSCYTKGTMHANDYVGGIVGLSGDMNTLDMNQCGAIMDIDAHSYVGGLCGRSCAKTSYVNYNSYINKCYAIGDISATGNFVGGLVGHTIGFYHYYYDRNAYYNEFITNNYFNGSVVGDNYVGGLFGYVYGSKISKNYCAASVNGNSHVGGLVGRVDNGEAKVKSNAALNISVNATVENVGRIYGSISGDIGATMGTSDENRALLTTMVSANGIGLSVDDDMQNGTSFGAETFKLRATYQGLGWDFNSDWRSQETECYPYNPAQAAPPIILSGAVSGSTTIHGKSYDGGTVYVTVGNKTYTTTCVGNLWDVTTDPQQAGDLIRAYAVAEDLNQSYYTTQYVNYKGSGTQEDPYQIFTAADLARLNGSYYYKLMNNINLSTYITQNSPVEGWQPVGRNGAVMAHFDGGGHTISGLWCESSKDYTGLFANASSNTICNLTVKVASSKKVAGKKYTGILLGNNTNGKVVNCSVIGNVEGENYTGGMIGRANDCVINSSHVQGNVSGTVLVGGMVGEANNGSIENCSTDVDVSSSTAEAYVGGMIGSNSSVVSACRSTGSVESMGAGANAGGLIGTTTGNVTNSFSAATLSMAFDAVYMGGLIGTNYATVDKCYASGNLDGAKWAGGLVGENIGENAYVKNSFANNHIVNVKDPTGYAERVIGGYKDGAKTPEKSNYALDEMQVSVNNVPMVVYDDIINGIAKTETELKSAATYSALGWDMKNVWSIEEGKSYPVLSDVASVPTIPDDGGDGDNPDDEDEPGADDNEPDTDISELANAIYFDSFETSKGSVVEVPVLMKNEGTIAGYEFNLSLPKGISMPLNEDDEYEIELSEERTTYRNHNIFDSALKEDGTIYVLCNSTKSKIFSGNDGEVAVMTLQIAENIEPGTYPVVFKNVILSDSKANAIKLGNMKFSITVKAFEPGDSNGDGEVNGADITAIANHLLGNPNSNFEEKPADANGDGEVNGADITAIANILLYGSVRGNE